MRSAVSWTAAVGFLAFALACPVLPPPALAQEAEPAGGPEAEETPEEPPEPTEPVKPPDTPGEPVKPPETPPATVKPPDTPPATIIPPDSGKPWAGESAHGAPDGFGRNARGGGGAPKSVGASASAIAAALKGGGIVKVAKGDIDARSGQIVLGSNVTLDGGGATLWYPGNEHNSRGVNFTGDGAILRNLRIRNGGDCIDFGSNSSRSSNSLVENVTVSGSGDDGFSPSWNSRDITIRWSMAAGCTRAVFNKYGASNLTMHHNILTHYWMRGPLCSGITARLDFRNNLVEYWSSWGSRCEDGALGNFVNNTWRQESWTGGSGASALYIEPDAEAVKWNLKNNGQTKIHSAGNAFIGCSQKAGGFEAAPVFEAPPISGLTDAKAAMDAVLSDTDGAGCMPRDAIDKGYLAYKKKWIARPSDKTVAFGLQLPETEKHLKGGSTGSKTTTGSKTAPKTPPPKKTKK